MNIRSLLDKFDSAASWLQSPLLLLIRYWGWRFARGAWGKLNNLDKTTAFFDSLHIPMPKLNAVLASTTELVCGSLLLLGLFARPAAVPLIGVMMVAYITADSEALHSFFSDPDKFFAADPFLFLFAAVIILAFGPGKLSLDALFRKSASAR